MSGLGFGQRFSDVRHGTLSRHQARLYAPAAQSGAARLFDQLPEDALSFANRLVVVEQQVARFADLCHDLSSEISFGAQGDRDLDVLFHARGHAIHDPHLFVAGQRIASQLESGGEGHDRFIQRESVVARIDATIVQRIEQNFGRGDQAQVVRARLIGQKRDPRGDVRHRGGKPLAQLVGVELAVSISRDEQHGLWVPPENASQKRIEVGLKLTHLLGTKVHVPIRRDTKCGAGLWAIRPG